MHDVENKGVNLTLVTFGIAASCMCLLVSAAMNAKFMMSLAPKDSLDAYIYAAGGIAIDVYMGLAPFFFFAAIRSKEWMRALFAIFIWIAVTAFSAQAAIGHFAANRTHTMSGQVVASTNYADAREDLKQARKELGFVPEHRPTATVRAEIAKLQVNPTWIQTNECTLANGKIARAYCLQYQTLSAELGNAMQADKITARIEALTAKSDKVSSENANVAADSDPQARVMSDMSGYKESTMRGVVIFLGVFVFLLVAGMGPYTAFAPMANRRKIIDLKPVPVATDAPPLALEAPEEETPPLPPSNEIVVRDEPSAEGRAALDAISFPPVRLHPDEPRRPKDTPDESARRFLWWMAAYGLGGQSGRRDFLPEELNALYDEFTQGDHREPLVERQWKEALAANRRYVEKTKPRARVAGEKRPTVWTISPPTLKPLKAPEPKAPATAKNVVSIMSRRGA